MLRVALSSVVGWCALWMAPGWAQPVDSTLTLQAAWQRVAQANRDVLLARRAADAARADVDAATVTPPPQLSINSSSIQLTHPGGGPLWQRSIDTIVRIDQPIERGGKAEHRVRAASAGWQAARQDVADAERQQRVAVAQAYWDLKLAQEQVRLAEANVQLAQRSSEAARKRLEQGDLSKLEATRLAVEAGRAANEWAQARSQSEQASWALKQLLAQDDAARFVASDPWPDVLRFDPTADDAWLATRPDVQAAQRRVEQAQAAMDLAHAQRAADVTVGVQFEHNPPTGDRLWGVGVSIPLGVDGRQAGPEAHALAAVAQAEIQLDKVRAAALAERATSLSQVRAAQERVQRLEGEIVPQARAAADAADFARQQGAMGLQDVLDARRALHAAELDALTAHADLAKALAVLDLTPSTDSP